MGLVWENSNSPKQETCVFGGADGIEDRAAEARLLDLSLEDLLLDRSLKQEREKGKKSE